MEKILNCKTSNPQSFLDMAGECAKFSQNVLDTTLCIDNISSYIILFTILETTKFACNCDYFVDELASLKLAV
jgi:hypothetical protein